MVINKINYMINTNLLSLYIKRNIKSHSIINKPLLVSKKPNSAQRKIAKKIDVSNGNIYVPILKIKKNNILFSQALHLNTTNYYTKKKKQENYGYVPSRSMMTVSNTTRKTLALPFYHGLKIFSTPKVVNTTTKTNSNNLLSEIIKYSNDINNGAPQHKYSYIFQLLRHKFTFEQIKKEFQKLYPELNGQIDFPNSGCSDLRIVGELPVAIAILKNLPNITKLKFSGDLPPDQPNSPFLLKRKQANPDFIVDIDGKYGQKQIYQDVKSGMDLFKNTTRGHVGIVTFIENQLIPTTKKPLNISHLEHYNFERLKGLETVCDTDNNGVVSPHILGAFEKGWGILNRSKAAKIPFSIEQHNEVQYHYWTEVQNHTDFKRSVGLIFIQYIGRTPTDQEYEKFTSRISQLLPDGVYDISRPQDKHFLLQVSLRAFIETVDPLLPAKLLHLNSQGIHLDSMVLDILKNIALGKYK
jgi:hypothetical protein